MLSILVVLLVLVLALWALSLVPFPPNAGPLRSIIGVILIVLVIFWLLVGSGLVVSPAPRWR